MIIKDISRLLFLAVFMTIAAIEDAKKRTIPNWLTFPMILLGICQFIILKQTWWLELCIAVLVLFLLAILTVVGMGDVKLLLGMCFWTHPIHVMLSLALASIFVVLVQFIKSPYATSAAIFWPKKHISKAEKTELNSVPFAPYLLVSTIITEGAFLLWHIF